MAPKNRKGRGLNKRQKKTVSQMVDDKLNREIETKFQDTFNSVFPDDAAGTVIPLSNIAQSNPAATDSTRVGDEISIKSIDVRLVASAGILAGITTPTVLRCLILQWHGQFSLDPPSLSKIFGAVGLVGTASALRPYNHDNKPKFRVLYDKQLELGYNSDAIQSWKIKLKPKLRKTQFYAGTTDQKEGIYMVFVSGVDILGVLPAVTYSSRVTYKDA